MIDIAFLFFFFPLKSRFLQSFFSYSHLYLPFSDIIESHNDFHHCNVIGVSLPELAELSVATPEVWRHTHVTILRKDDVW